VGIIERMRPHAGLLFLLSGALPAQTLRFVGPGGFATIQAAIDASTAGDIIEIAGGQYAPFTVDRAVTLTAAAGATVDVMAQTFAGGSVLFSAPTGCTKVRGIRFRNPTAFWLQCSILVQNSTASFTDCLFEAHTNEYQGALSARSAAVQLERCILLGSGGPTNSTYPGVGASACSALKAYRSWIAAVDCGFFAGMQNWDFGFPVGHGVHCDGSAVHLVRCTAIGATNSWLTCASYEGGDGLRVDAALQVSVADCQLIGGSGHCGLGGHGLRNLTTAPVLLARTTAIGGYGGSTPGQPFVGPTASAPLLGLASPTVPLQRGAPWIVEYQAQPSALVLPAVSFDLAPHTDPRCFQRVWTPADATPLPVVTADAAGVVRLSFAVPANPALRGAAAWMHAFTPDAARFQSAPPIGGVVP
jgi:hypothetical protein